MLANQRTIWENFQKIRHHFQAFNVLDYGAKGDGVTDDTEAIQRTLDAATNNSIVIVPGGTYKFTSAISVPQRNITIQGMGQECSVFKYTGSTFSNGFEIDTLGEGYIRIFDLGIKGGNWGIGETCKLRYAISAGNLNAGCELNRLNLRDSNGYIKITAGYLSKLDNIRCENTPPNITVSGISHANWLEIWDEGHAPIDLAGMNAATIGLITCYRIGMETSSGITGESLFRLYGSQPIDIGVVSFEGNTSYSSYTIRQKHLMKIEGAIVNIGGFYNEANYCTDSFVIGRVGAQVQISAMHGYNSYAESAMIKNESCWDMRIKSSMMYAMFSPYLYKVTQSGLSTQGIVAFESCLVAAGGVYTDSTFNANSENVMDTYGSGSANLHGIADQDELTYSSNRICTPKRNTGLVVTAGSDPTYPQLAPASTTATGHFIQITSGIYFNEAGQVITVKRPDGTLGSSTPIAFRLRPATASKYYRLYVGTAGNVYLIESATAFADDRGNWIAQFRTNASTEIVRYSDGATAGLDADPYNPRLTVYGSYVPNQNTISAMGTAAPTSGQWIVGDFVRNSAASATTPFGWLCVTAGTPGTWQAIEDPTFIKLAKSVDGVWEAQRFVNEEQTAASTNEVIRFHYRFRGGGSSSDRTAGYFEVRKDGDFGSSGAMDGAFVFAPSIDETPTDMLRVDQLGIDIMTAGKRFKFQEGPIVRAGSGTPEGAVTAVVGSMFLRTDGGAATSFYIKESGSGNTGWVAK